MTVYYVDSWPEWEQTLASDLQHLCIAVNADEPPAWRSGAKQFFRVPPLPQGGVDIYALGLRVQRLNDFPHEHGNVLIALVEVHRQIKMVVI
jgi:hypothetical protein